VTTLIIKNGLSVPDGRPLADFLPTITIKAKDFANEITTTLIRQQNMRGEVTTAQEHVKSNSDVRKLLTDRNIVPQNLPAAEDVKRAENSYSRFKPCEQIQVNLSFHQVS
jgi:DNA-damage-inducible protein D